MAHILVVDDDDAVRELVTMILEIEGYFVSTANGGRMALEAVEKLSPHLILSDLQMPEMDGWMLFREVKARYPEIPFVAMSGHTGASGALKNGFDAFVPKPFGLQDLIETVGHTITR